jgi:hypothetical protein
MDGRIFANIHSSELSWISQLWTGTGTEVLDWRWVDNRGMGGC